MKEFNLDFGQNFISAIANSISEAVSYDIKQSKQLLNTHTTNSTPNLIWDLINTNIKNKLGKENVEIITQKIGLWEFLIVYDKSSNNVLTIMRDARLKLLVRGQNKYKKHYAAILAYRFNKGLQPKARQRTLFVVSSNETEDNKYKEMMSNELCSKFESLGDNSRYAIISFSASNYQLNSLAVSLFTPKFEPVHKESLDNYIKPSYDSIPDTLELKTTPDIEIKLTQEALKKKDESNKEEMPLLKEDESSDKNNQSAGE